MTGWLWLLIGCRPPVAAVPSDAHPHTADLAWHRAAHAAATARVVDTRRGGPPVTPTSSPLPPFLGVNRGTATYAGSEQCADCHQDAFTLWGTTAHRSAFQTLSEAQSAFNPRCLRCHTQGMGHPGGFDGAPRLRDVGCESCHGPGSDHLANPAPGYGDLPLDGSACVACHNIDTSPDFRWQTHWPRIAH